MAITDPRTTPTIRPDELIGHGCPKAAHQRRQQKVADRLEAWVRVPANIVARDHHGAPDIAEEHDHPDRPTALQIPRIILWGW